MGKKNKYRKKRVSDDRLSQLREGLEASDTELLGGVSDDEMAALADHLADQVGDARGAALLVELQPLAESKAQRKAINKALYRLERRGVEVPTWRERPDGIDLRAPTESITDLPVMLNEPSAGGTRHLLLPHQSGRLLQVVQVQLNQSHGLAQLRAGEVNRRGYRDLVKRLVAASVVDGSPAAVTADDAFRRRKLWEIGRLVGAHRTGTEVDAELVSELRWPDEPPPHPAWDLALDEAEPLSGPELSVATRLAVPFIGKGLWDRVDQALAKAETSPLILSQSTERERATRVYREAVDAELADWAPEALVEFALDVALFHGLAGNPREARTVRDALERRPERDESELEARSDGLRDFIVGFVGHFFAQGAPEEPEPDSGLILP